MITAIIALILSNFTVAMIVLGILLAALSIYRSDSPRNRELVTDRLLAYLLLCAAGFTGVHGFIMHTFFSDFTAHFIGWQSNPFQFEVGMANLAVGILGILAFRAGRGFRSATVIATSIFLLGAWVGHIVQMVTQHNFAPGNAGSIFYTDLIIPVLLLTLLLLRYRSQA